MFSNMSRRRREGSRSKIKGMGDHKEFLNRITKTLYYGQLPTLPCLSLPVTEVSCSVWSAPQRGRSLRRLHADAAARLARGACVSPCALVLALVYLERLRACNPHYVHATHPNQLFLISLMVGNKFLQDDGEDDEVICSEWAASGGIELDHLKKLEVEFLNAIDWNVFVNDTSFEMGLSWLEREVALKQAQMRGFFTYSDLVAAGAGEPLVEEARAAAIACLTLTITYMTSLLAVLTSTLMLSHTWLPALQLIAHTTTSIAHTNIITHNHPELHVNNSTLDTLLLDTAYTLPDLEIPTCCNKWTQYQATITPKRNWYDAVILYDWKFEPWWSKTSVLNWLYQTSLVNPMQRWLERVKEYADLFKRDIVSEDSSDGYGKCEGHWKQAKCVRQWMNLSKLNAIATSVSDR